MSYGSTAYESYVRIHVESGRTRVPPWNQLTHLRRLAWEAAAQAVAMAVLPQFQVEEDEDDDEEIPDTLIDETPDLPVPVL